MSDQDIETFSDPVTVATNNISEFPDWETAILGGYVLRPGAVYKNSDTDVFMRQATTKGTYTVIADGTVTQVSTGF